MKPLVSVIIPLFNRENLILETLNSVLTQTYQNWECIIVDDGSTDQSYAVAENFIKGKSQFKLYKRSQQHKPGGAGARNFGYLKSNGDYILWLDSDDLLEDHKLELQIKDLLQYNGDLSISKWRFFPEQLSFKKCPEDIFKDKKTNFKTVFHSMGVEQSFFALHSYLIKREVVTKSGLWLEDLHLNDDGEFFSRILMNSNSITLNKNTYALYRIHTGERISLETSVDKFKECILSWQIIEAHLKLISDDEFEEYINSKKTLLFYQLLNNNYKNIINANKDFFQYQVKTYKAYNSYYNQVKVWLYNTFYK